MKFTYNQNDGLSLEKSLSLEWLETNGLGGYSSSTIINCNTRKYHGLLVSKLDEPVGKYVLLAKVDDVLLQDGNEKYLSATKYANHFQDGSFNNLHNFILDTHPTSNFKFAKINLSKEILMPHHQNTILIRYKIDHQKNNLIKIRPFIAARDYHSLAHENTSIQTETEQCKNGCKFTPYQGMPCLYLQANTEFEFIPEPLWYRDYEYEVEKQRGFPCNEDLFSPGVFILNFDNNGEIIFSCSTRQIDADLYKEWQNELTYRNNNLKKIKGNSLQKQLKTVADSFMQKSLQDDLISIIAGYHWFVEWGRDAMISLPGLTLYSGLEHECLATLRKFANHEYRGLIPNFLGKTADQNAYNSVDASLWFAWATQQYYLKTNDCNSIKQYLWQTLKNIYFNYKAGTLCEIRMLENGLIYAGNEKLNLTWMDAMVDEQPVIKRYGMHVEINALWYNMLCFINELAEYFADPIKEELKPLTGKVKLAFRATFWDPKLGYLRDYVNEQQKNADIRPNQIFAVSMPYSILTKKMAIQVMKTVKQHLFTPYGLRTLSPQNPRYIGIYSGDSRTRDTAYHEGTVWPWLIGHFGEALLKVFLNKNEVKKVLKPCINALTDHLANAGIGSISEVFDGDAPHRPNGCISQAWSVAEVLRLIYLLEV